MRSSLLSAFAVIGAGIAITSTASAAIVVTQQAAAAPTYSTLINFNDLAPGTYAGNTWAAQGLTTLTDGANPSVSIENVSGSFPWIPTNAANGFNFGLFFAFANDVTEASFQIWTSAQSGPFGGVGINFFDANDNLLHSAAVSQVWGGTGNSWINVTTNGGSSFAKMSIAYGGFGFPQLFVDNVSWNAVPAPGALALLGVAMVGGSRRRR